MIVGAAQDSLRRERMSNVYDLEAARGGPVPDRASDVAAPGHAHHGTGARCRPVSRDRGWTRPTPSSRPPPARRHFATCTRALQTCTGRAQEASRQPRYTPDAQRNRLPTILLVALALTICQTHTTPLHGDAYYPRVRSPASWSPPSAFSSYTGRLTRRPLRFGRELPLSGISGSTLARTARGTAA